MLFLGFSRGLRPCRSCMVTHSTLGSSFTEENFQLRTPEMYNAQSLLCTNNPAISSTYGIKCTSIFNELKYFNVSEGLPHDLSHDYFEGVIHETLSLVLTRLISEKLFTLDILNTYIEHFKYRY